LIIIPLLDKRALDIFKSKGKKESFNGTHVTHYLLRSKQYIAILSTVGVMGDRSIVKRFIPEVPSVLQKNEY